MMLFSWGNILKKMCILTPVIMALIISGTLGPALAEDEPIRLPPKMSDLKILHQEPAVFPSVARENFAEGKVDVEVTVGKDGNVIDVNVLKVKIKRNKKLYQEAQAKKPPKSDDEELSYPEKEALKDEIRNSFQEAAKTAALKWKFEPQKAGEKKVSVIIPLEFNFGLEQKGDKQPGAAPQK
ncbi:energy transducer TonB [candidate division CSSED10-310 bacterium]|uniref:Energy transducer TonB n=1 Tax=candidate division CSSED10-310 bacterium TaxID=2855610 RepID=A0ABV6YZ53_UNCC1